MSFNLLVALILFGSLVAINGDRTDKTLADKAVGEEVVDAVVDLISKSNIFPNDYRFLLRIGYIESKFGDDPNTFAERNGTNYNGGIWQVDSTTFTNTQNSGAQNIKDLYVKIRQLFNIDWNNLTWVDCRKPLVSALAARLSLALIPTPIPDTLEAQASYWLKNYNSAATKSTEQQFIGNVKEMEKRNKCHGRMNLAIVMDGSGSIGDSNFNLARKFVVDLISTFSENNVNLGYVIFSSAAQVI